MTRRFLPDLLRFAQLPLGLRGWKSPKIKLYQIVFQLDSLSGFLPYLSYHSSQLLLLCVAFLSEIVLMSLLYLFRLVGRCLQ